MSGTVSFFKDVIRLDLIYQIVWSRRKKLVLFSAITAVLAYVLILAVPRTYTATVVLAPEYDNGSSSGVTGIASSLGLDLGGINASEDAIVPSFYPDLMRSTDFVVPLFDVPVKTLDGTFEGTYREYLLTQTQSAWWSKMINFVKNGFKSSKPNKAVLTEKVDPYRLTERQTLLAKVISASILCNVDRKTSVISLTCISQDPLVSTMMADAVKEKLQIAITEYRTAKARNELEHARLLRENSYADYLKKQKEYAAYADSHNDLVLNEYRMKMEALENEMQIAFNAYSASKSQEQMAEAKVSQKTPAFTTLQNATVPVKPSGPKRVMFAMAMAVLCFFILSAYWVYKGRYGFAEQKKKENHSEGEGKGPEGIVSSEHSVSNP